MPRGLGTRSRSPVSEGPEPNDAAGAVQARDGRRRRAWPEDGPTVTVRLERGNFRDMRPPQFEDDHPPWSRKRDVPGPA
jgi:hypothetical protein